MSDLIPEGYYKARAVAQIDDHGSTSYARLARAKSGNEQVVATFEVTDGPQAGARLPWFGSFTEKSTERTIEALRLMGLRGDDLSEVSTQDLGRDVSIKVGHNTYEGKTTARVDFVNPLGGRAMKIKDPIAGDSAKMFAEKMRGKLAKIPEVATQVVDAPSEIAEDKVPF